MIYGLFITLSFVCYTTIEPKVDFRSRHFKKERDMYTIGEVSKMMNLPVSTLRYYDNEGLFPNLVRESGIRKFSDNEIEALRVIECLKKSGLEIKDIKLFMDWCQEGPSTYSKRLELIKTQKERVEKQMEQLEKAMNMLKYKCWFYSQLANGGNEEEVRTSIPDALPKDIHEAYINSHK